MIIEYILMSTLSLKYIINNILTLFLKILHKCRIKMCLKAWITAVQSLYSKLVFLYFLVYESCLFVKMSLRLKHLLLNFSWIYSDIEYFLCFRIKIFYTLKYIGFIAKIFFVYLFDYLLSYDIHCILLKIIYD